MMFENYCMFPKVPRQLPGGFSETRTIKLIGKGKATTTVINPTFNKFKLLLKVIFVAE